MGQLPRFDPADVATKSDLVDLRTELRADLAATNKDLADLRVEVRDGLAAVNQRLDRLFLTLLIGMFGVIGALVGLMFRLG